jgi:hypothetical protein
MVHDFVERALHHRIDRFAAFVGEDERQKACSPDGEQRKLVIEAARTTKRDEGT